MKLFVVSDIHGKYLEFLEIVSYKPKDYTLVINGDIIDKGYDSLSIIKWIRNNPDTILITGNHDKKYMDWYEKHKGNISIKKFENGHISAPFKKEVTGSPLFIRQLIRESKGDSSKFQQLCAFVNNTLKTSLFYYKVDNVIISHSPYQSKNLFEGYKFLSNREIPEEIEGVTTIHGHTNRYEYDDKLKLYEKPFNVIKLNNNFFYNGIKLFINDSSRSIGLDLHSEDKTVGIRFDTSDTSFWDSYKEYIVDDIIIDTEYKKIKDEHKW